MQQSSLYRENCVSIFTSGYWAGWGMALVFSSMAWLLTFLESVLTLSLMDGTALWSHNYMAFATALTFVFAFVYMKKQEDLSWLEEGVAFAIVFVLVNLFLDYAVVFLWLKTYIFTVQNFVLYAAQFLVCLLAAFVVKKKYVDSLGLRL